jgi:hypothetical protein
MDNVQGRLCPSAPDPLPAFFFVRVCFHFAKHLKTFEKNGETLWPFCNAMRDNRAGMDYNVY